MPLGQILKGSIKTQCNFNPDSFWCSDFYKFLGVWILILTFALAIESSIKLIKLRNTKNIPQEQINGKKRKKQTSDEQNILLLAIALGIFGLWMIKT